MLRTLFGVLIVAVGLSGCGKVTPEKDDPADIILEVKADGTILWNGTEVDDVTLMARFREAADNKPGPNIRLRPDQTAKYDRVAQILAKAQSVGNLHFGFAGIDTGD